jgi:hypothetical protein
MQKPRALNSRFFFIVHQTQMWVSDCEIILFGMDSILLLLIGQDEQNFQDICLSSSISGRN